MTCRVLGVLQVLFALRGSPGPTRIEQVARLLGWSPEEVGRAVRKLGQWRLVEPESLWPTVTGHVTAHRLRESFAAPP